MLFCKKVPRGFDSLQICPQFADWPSERLEVLQCGPQGERPARLAGIRRARPRSRPGKGEEGVPTPQGVDFGAWPGRGEGLRGGLPAAGDGGRCKTASGEAAARPGLCAALEAPEDPSEGG
jgi:hypothetical protein